MQDPAPPGARRSAAPLVQLADAIGSLLTENRYEAAALEVLDAIKNGAAPVGDTARLELMDRLLVQLRRTLGSHGWWLHGPNRMRGLLSVIARWLSEREDSGGCFVEFGCGRENPLAISALMYLNGFDRCIACDVDPCMDPERAALAMYDLLVDCLAHPDDYRVAKVPRWKVEDRVRTFDLKRLQDGDLAGGVAGTPCRHEIGEMRSVWEAAGRPAVRLVASFSVMEHVRDLAAIADTFRAMVPPGGGMVHQVDFRDHRTYTMPISPWGYLVEGSEPQTISNEVRCSAMVAMVEERGFRARSITRVEADPPPEVWQGLKEAFRGLPALDITTQNAAIVFDRIEG